MSASHYDVAVIGAGPAGSAAAYYLAQGGLRVALLDKFDFPRDKTCGDGLTPRALSVLDSMGVLPRVEQHSYPCVALTVRNSDEVTYRIELSGPDDPPRRILIVPRLTLDDTLRQHAIEAGAQFIPHTKVENITHQENSHVRLWCEGGQTLDCRLAVVATGANTGLLRKVGLLEHRPPSNLAARAYFENVDGLDDTIVLFFDGVEHPGYGWVFPTGSGAANIGCGVFFDSHTPQPSHLRHIVQHHPYLRRILKHARQIGPIKGHPLRTDFSRAISGRDQILVTGEAIGLVNPITGEGIDYALESAQMVAGAILEDWRDGSGSAAIQKNYRTALDKKFRFPFALGHLAQRLGFRDGIVDKALRRIQHRPHLHRVVIDACFGLADPISILTPRTFWELLKP
ncbi:MAG TPA: geranylgeranyl reductase family protein [Anaerolineales bacterium]|nr:geranylgeranyl reductase family protein [Anaerolineales bacterium]